VDDPPLRNGGTARLDCSGASAYPARAIEPATPGGTPEPFSQAKDETGPATRQNRGVPDLHIAKQLAAEWLSARMSVRAQ